ncbi:MAG: cupin-like domain-containing protein, partial [Natronospirillum sp.]
GDLELINLISKSLLRPSTDARERLEYATQRQSFAYGVSEVKRVEQASEFEILEALDEGRPMIITEPALMSSRDTWTLDALAAQYGEVPLRVRSADQRQTVAEFIAELQNKDRSDLRIIEGHTKAYTEGCALPSAMRPDFVPGYFSLHDYIEPQIWLGSVPTDVPASSLHRDPLDGFLFQIIGRKRLVLYSPDQAPLLYSSKAWNNYQPCWVSPNSPDYQRFPDFREARRLEVVLQPGELLVQPAGWFHEVSCLDSPTFSVSYFYRH